MRVVVDGIIYQKQSQGGISRLFSEILPRMCDLDSSLEVTLLAAGWCKQPLPAHPHIRQVRAFPVENLLRPRRIWRPLVPRVRAVAQGLQLGNRPGSIWHSTYYTMPRSWNGSIVVTVVDITHERLPQFLVGRANDRFRQQKRPSGTWSALTRRGSHLA